MGLFWHDTWLPGLSSIMSQGDQLAGFSGAYLLDLADRFINWQMLGALFVLLVLYLFISPWIRITVLVSLMLIWLNVLTIAGPAMSLLPTPQVVLNQTPAAASQAAAVPDGLDQSAAPTSYSGPAGIRLLRASCGQTSHSELYKPTDSRCYLFDNLAKLGFKEQLMMDHTACSVTISRNCARAAIFRHR